MVKDSLTPIRVIVVNAVGGWESNLQMRKNILTLAQTYVEIFQEYAEESKGKEIEVMLIDSTQKVLELASESLEDGYQVSVVFLTSTGGVLEVADDIQAKLPWAKVFVFSGAERTRAAVIPKSAARRPETLIDLVVPA